MDDQQRQRLLERVERRSATVGATIPETIEIAGEELPLAEFIIETRRVPGVPPEAEETLEAAKRTLRQERRRRKQRLESDPLDLDTAERIADEIVGIDRALNALENIRRPDYGEEASEATIEDHKRWVKFLNTVKR